MYTVFCSWVDNQSVCTTESAWQMSSAWFTGLDVIQDDKF